MVHTRHQRNEVLNSTTTTGLNINFSFNMLPFDNFNTPTGNTPVGTPNRPTLPNFTPDAAALRDIPNDIFETELVSSLQSYVEELSGYQTPKQTVLMSASMETPLIPSGLLLQGGFTENDSVCRSMLGSVVSTPLKQFRNELISPPRIIRRPFSGNKVIKNTVVDSVLHSVSDFPMTTISSTTKVLELVNNRLDNLQEIVPKILKRSRDEESEESNLPKRLCPNRDRKTYVAAAPLDLSPSKHVHRFIIQNKDSIVNQLNRLRLESIDSIPLVPVSSPIIELSSNIVNSSDVQSTTIAEPVIQMVAEPTAEPVIQMVAEPTAECTLTSTNGRKKKAGFLSDNYCTDMTSEEYFKNLQFRLRTYAFPGSYNLRNAKSAEQFIVLLQRERMFAESKDIPFNELQNMVNLSLSRSIHSERNWQFGIDLVHQDRYLQLLKDFFKEN